jgi:A/G-specific adenine glycosylase
MSSFVTCRKGSEMQITPQQKALARQATDILLPWYQANQRSFVFRGIRNPYRIWLSEVMLQQTRTATVEAYYLRFLQAFPDVFALASAKEESVLKAWEGLGYYTRARNLHKAAKLVAGQMGGEFPKTSEELQELPGVGPYAAAAIASIAYDEPVPAMDGNLNRVISRLFMVEEEVSQPRIKGLLHALGTAMMPPKGAGDMNQALMDMGATICLPGTPDCKICPVAGKCLAHLRGDPAALPVMKQKKPPRIIPVGVGIVTHENQVLVFRRKETLLKGLYVFCLTEGDNSRQAVGAAAHKALPGAVLAEELGEAKHIFTHRIWQMKLYHVKTSGNHSVPGGKWVDLDKLLSLPMPVAMDKAREEALRILNELKC